MSYLKDFQKRIEENDYPGFLKLWEEFCYSDECDSKEFIKILETVKASSLNASFGNHVEKSLTLWETIQDPKASHEVLKSIFDLQSTNHDSLFEFALNYLTKRYPGDIHFQEKARLIGLRLGGNFQGAISNYELLSHMQKGNFVFHSKGWGVSEIMDVSLIREELSLECDFVVGIKHISFLNAFKTLIPLSNDHFLVRRFGNPDLLEKQSRENPTEVIRCMLRDLGPKTAAEIKEELSDLVIPLEDWNRWWQTARSKIKKDTKIESPKTLKLPFQLRDEEIPHEVAFYKALESKPDISQIIQMVYSFIRDFSETLKNKEFRSSLETKIQTLLNADELLEAHRIPLLFFMEDLYEEKKHDRSKKWILECKDLNQLLQDIDIISYKKRILTIVRSVRKDWQAIFFASLFSIDQSLIRDYILNELMKNNVFDELKNKISELLKYPVSYPELYVWYFQKLLDKKSKIPYADSKGRSRFFEGFLILLDHLEQKPNYRDLAKKMVSILLQKRFQVVRDILKESTLEDVQEFLLLATKCEIFTDHDIKIIRSLAEVVYPALSKGKEEEEEEEIIWTTKESYQKTQQKIEKIATVDTVENAKEIEEARSHGDLRENAEFKSALERRDRLQAELQFLSTQLDHARILTHSDVSIHSVDVGTIVECENTKGETKRFTLLGPWDANPEKNILSFQSKLAKSMKGKKIGEKFQFQQEEFTIIDIHNFFDEK